MNLAQQPRHCCGYAPRAAIACALTEREIECLTWVARGKTAPDIGTILGISPNTVNYHLKSTGAKLRVAGRTQMVVRAMQHGLIQP